MSKLFREDVEIISSASGQSGLKLVNLPTGTPQTVFNGILGLDASGNVIKIDATKIATVTVGPVAPSAPVSGQQWLDTSVSPSELKIYNGTSWELAGDEVQHYTNFAAFPATGDEDVLYVDDDAEIVYVWDSTTSAYVNASGTGAGLFSITDGTTTQSIGVGDTLTILDANLISAVVTATDTLTIGLDTTGATTGQVPSYNGTTVVWANADNIYTADGTLNSDTRIITANGNDDQFKRYATPNNNSEISETISDAGASGQRAQTSYFASGSTLTLGMINGLALIQSLGSLTIDSGTGEYFITNVPTATTQTQSLVRDASTGRLYLKDLATLSTARYANTWTPTANVETVHTHALSAGEDIQIQVRDATTKEIVDVEIRIISATTFGVTSTTADPLRVIAL